MAGKGEEILGSNFREGLAPYASDARLSRGRLVKEAASKTRSPFQRDRDRIIHSTAFRRLKHKTQVFVSHEGDHYRTRLTHSIEVSQIARSIARALRVDEDLAEALALVHDFGHTPFGHAGERALQRKMSGNDGFEHNAQALRIVTKLEQRYIHFDGLNLTWEVLEGLIKHNGPLMGELADPKHKAPQPVLDYCDLHDLELSTFSSIEAQAAAISDDIAYNSADLDDGMRAGLFGLEDLRNVGLVGPILESIEVRHSDANSERKGAEIVRQVVTSLVEDAIFTSADALAALNAKSVDDIRAAKKQMVAFSQDMETQLDGLREFLYANMYRHPKVMTVMSGAETLVERLFDQYLAEPLQMGEAWQDLIIRSDEAKLKRQVADYISGMTDDFALREGRRLFDDEPDLL